MVSNVKMIMAGQAISWCMTFQKAPIGGSTCIISEQKMEYLAGERMIKYACGSIV